MTKRRNYWVWTAKAGLTLLDDRSAPKRTGSRSGPDSWWSCSPDTKAGDIAFVYRPAGGKTAKDPVVGVRLVVEALSNALDLSNDAYATRQGWSHGCRYQVLALLKRPVALDALRELGIVSDGSIGVLRAHNRLTLDQGRDLLALIKNQGQSVRMPLLPETRGGYRRELDLQAEILAPGNLATALRRLGIRPPKEIRLIPADDLPANVSAEMPVKHDGRRRRADIVADEDGLLGRRVVIELKNTPATRAHLTQTLDYRREIERRGFRRPAAVLVAESFPEDVCSAARKERIRLVTIAELGIPIGASAVAGEPSRRR